MPITTFADFCDLICDLPPESKNQDRAWAIYDDCRAWQRILIAGLKQVEPAVYFDLWRVAVEGSGQPLSRVLILEEVADNLKEYLPTADHSQYTIPRQELGYTYQVFKWPIKVVKTWIRPQKGSFFRPNKHPVYVTEVLARYAIIPYHFYHRF